MLTERSPKSSLCMQRQQGFLWEQVLWYAKRVRESLRCSALHALTIRSSHPGLPIGLHSVSADRGSFWIDTHGHRSDFCEIVVFTIVLWMHGNHADCNPVIRSAWFPCIHSTMVKTTLSQKSLRWQWDQFLRTPGQRPHIMCITLGNPGWLDPSGKNMWSDHTIQCDYTISKKWTFVHTEVSFYHTIKIWSHCKKFVHTINF